MSTNQITMKLTDIDLSSLAEVAAAVTLLEHVRREMATGGTPLPSLPSLPRDTWTGQLVVNPAMERHTTFGEVARAIAEDTEPVPVWASAAMDRALAADAEKLRGLGVDPVTAQPLATGDAVVIQGLGVGTIGEAVTSMDAASVFGGAPAQSATPLPPAPSTAGVAASPTAPAVLPASGALPTLPALAPLPAPAAAAPAVHAAPSSPAGGVELDTDGLPWDERIHAGTKRKNADGRWTSKRGINDPDLVPSVVAQLRAQMAAGGVTTQSAAPLPASTPAPLTAPLAALPATSGLASLAAPTPLALPAAPTPAAPQQSSAPAPTTFQDFMTALTGEVQAGRVPIEALGAACQPLGGVSALNAKPELIPIAWASLKAKYPGML